MFQSINPVDGEVLVSYPELTEPQLQDQLSDGQLAYQYWRQRPIAERALYFFKLAKQLESNEARLAKLITLEMGKPFGQARAEIRKCALLCRYYAENAPAFLADQLRKSVAPQSKVIYQPLGIILGVMPWNFPFWQSLRFAIPTLVAGNTVLLKPAPNVPQSALALQEIMEAVFSDKGVFQTAFLDNDGVAQAIADTRVQGVALTGSDRAGSAVGALAGQHIKRCVLELGGSDAFIVLEDADLESAAKALVQSRVHNSGQTCISAKRLIILEAIAAQFIELIKKEMDALPVGDPFDPETRISALARPDIAENLQRQLAQSIEMGAKVELAGGRVAETNYFRPAILSNIQAGMPAFEEELFGPVLSVFIAKDEAAAIELANESKYGLGAAIWSSSRDRAEAIARALEVGAVAINNLLRSDPAMPFGGIKRSGIGRELAGEGLLEFVNIKSIAIY